MNENENITVNEADIDAAWAEDDGPGTAEADDGRMEQKPEADPQPEAAPPAHEAPAAPEGRRRNRQRQTRPSCSL